MAKHSRKTPQALSHTDQAPAAPAVGEDTPTETGEELEKRLKGLMEMDKVVLFMKGTPDMPQCGFSRAVCQILEIHGVPPEKMKTYDVLQDSELRNSIKEFS